MIIVTDVEKLKIKCRPVLEFEKKNVFKLANKMVNHLENHETGVGLSAPQIGSNLKFFVVFVNKEWKVFINPTIVEYSEKKVTDIEGCLSFPGVYGNVTRSKSIKLKYQVGSRYVITDFSGFDAIVIQHEYDHLHGIICTDIMTPLTEEQIAEKEAFEKAKEDAAKARQLEGYTKLAEGIRDGSIDFSTIPTSIIDAWPREEIQMPLCADTIVSASDDSLVEEVLETIIEEDVDAIVE